MKVIIRVFILSIICFFVVKQVLFNHTADPAANDRDVVAHHSFHTERMTWVGEQIRLQGVVKNSYYALGVGYYYLYDSNRERIGILCNHFPPVEGQLIEVTALVKPVLKIFAPVTLQIEVDTPIVILSQVPPLSIN